MKRVVEFIRSVPPIGWAVTVFLYAFQYGLYLLGPAISALTGTDSWAIVPKIPFIDDNIPLVKVFITIYVLSFAFWFIYMLIVATTDRANYINFILSFMLAAFIGFLFFVFMPTYMDRVAEGLIDAVKGPGILNWALMTIYSNDGLETARSLFPSFHCLISMFCILGVWKADNVSRSVKVLAVVFTVLVCLSTVFTKQHYFADIFGGLGLGVLCHAIVSKLDPGSVLVAKYRSRKAGK